MILKNRAEEAANDILRAFENPNDLPKPLSKIFIHRKDRVPCRKWSWRNQLITAIRGHSDARGFRQWETVGRRVKRGEQAFRILSPLTRKVENEETGEDKFLTYGFKGTPVFGLDQTQGDVLPQKDPDVDNWLKSLPLREVADNWGLSVEAYNGQGGRYLGKYLHGEGIALGVENLSTWCHELVHAADDRMGNLKKFGKKWRKETVAELGGAVLLQLLGHQYEADLGGCWEYVNDYAQRAGIDVLKACGRVLDRTCDAVALILDTAEAMSDVQEQMISQ